MRSPVKNYEIELVNGHKMMIKARTEPVIWKDGDITYIDSNGQKRRTSTKHINIREVGYE